MNQNILGDKKKTSFDDNLANVVNEIYDKMPDVPEQTVVPKNNSDVSSYHPNYFEGLDIEPFVHADKKTGTIAYLYFTESQRRIMGSGYQRHLSFQEQIGLYLLYLENKIPAHLRHLVEIVENMKPTYFEWCNQAYKMTINGKAQNFEIYEGVTRLDFDGTNYNEASLQFSGPVRRFAGPILKPEVNPLKNIKESAPILIKYFFTRKFEDLPECMQEESSIWIPEPGKILPITRGLLDNVFDVEGDVDGEHCESASRGVRVINRDAQELNELANQMQSGELKTNMGE